MSMVLAECMARRREPDCIHHGEKMMTMRSTLGDAIAVNATGVEITPGGAAAFIKDAPNLSTI
jgi:hypothetical protein